MISHETASIDWFVGSTFHSHVKTTSSAVNGSPSLHSTPGNRWNVTDERSAASSPLSCVGTSVIRLGSNVVSGA